MCSITSTDLAVRSQYTFGNVYFIDLFEAAGEALDVAGLDEHVQFAEDGAFELLDQVDRPDDAAQIEASFEPGGEVVHELDVFADALFDPRPDHLHGHLLTGFQTGGVHLGHGRGGHGRLVNAFKKLIRRLSQLGLDQPADALEGHRRDLILQFGKFIDIFRGKEVATRAHELAKLNEAGSQFLQGTTNAHRIGEAGFDLAAGSPPQSIGDFTHAVFDEHARDQPEMANAADAAAGKGKRHQITYLLSFLEEY